jgi:hypothetical protein
LEPKFQLFLRANVGRVAIERQDVGGLEGGSTFASAGNTQDRNSILLALKNSYKFGFSGESNVQYSRFRWNYAKTIQSQYPQVTILGVNDETLGVMESRLCF